MIFIYVHFHDWSRSYFGGKGHFIYNFINKTILNMAIISLNWMDDECHWGGHLHHVQARMQGGIQGVLLYAWRRGKYLFLENLILM